MSIEDKELFESALTDEAPQIEADTPAEQPEQQIEGQPRDENGRFATRQTEPEQNPEQQAEQPAKDEAHVPSWRLREVREEAERRVAETEARWQRQFNELQRQSQPKPEPQPVPDVFEDANGFLQHGVSQAVNPIKSELQAQREFMSQQFAESQYGAEKVNAAYDWIKQGLASRDPDAVATYQRAMQSMHPYGDIVKAHQQRAVYQQIGNDPNAWFEKELERRMADPAFAGAQLQRIQNSARGAQTPQGQSKIDLPPSLSRVAAAQVATDDDNDMSDAALFRHALR